MKIRLTLALCVLTSPVFATDFCHDLWWTRNALIDRAGYCFGSTLGKAAFDNAGCTGKSVNLSARASQKVAQIKELEARNSCRVNTKSTSLFIDDLATRRRLVDLPVRDETESSCIGFRAPSVALRAGIGTQHAVTYQVRQGDSVLYSHFDEGGWLYVVAYSSDGSVHGAGWMASEAIGFNDCRNWAG
ncbi:MAG: DUF4453 domain-containing protein [Pseudomonadota bacterium]